MAEEMKFVATIDHSDIHRKAKDIKNDMQSIKKEIEGSGVSIDDFAASISKLLQAFDRMTASIDKNTQEQQKSANMGRKAADEERKGAEKATKAIDETRRSTKGLGSDLDDMSDRASASFQKLTKYAAGFFTFQAAKSFASKIFEVRSEIQGLQTSFEILVGNKEKADELFTNLKEFAVSTPMQLKDLAGAAQTMMGFGIETDNIMDYLKDIGNIAMGDSQKFQSLALAFSQMSATGKLMGQDLLQMINQGFNPLTVMAEKTGKSIKQLKDEMSAGSITAEMVQQAFHDAASDGGKFAGMLEAQSKTLRGAYSNMQGAVDDMLNSIGGSTEGVFKSAIDAATWLAKNYETVGKTIAQLVTIYGTYKAALIANIALEKAQALNRLAHIKNLTTLQLLTDILRAKTEKLNFTMLKNPYIAVAAAVTALAASIYIWSKRSNEAEEAAKKLNEATSNTRAEIASERAEIDRLFNKLRNAKEGTAEYKAAKDEIMYQYGSYLNGLSQEIATLKDVEGAYKAVTQAVRESAIARGKDSAMKDVQERYGKSYGENIEKLQTILNKYSDTAVVSESLKQMQKDLRETGNITDETSKKIYALFGKGTSPGVRADRMDASRLLKNLRQNEQYLEDYTKLVEERFVLDEKEEKHAEKNATRNKSVIEEEKKAAQAELDALSSEEANAKKGAEIRDRINKLNAELKPYNVSSETKEGNDAKKRLAERIQQELTYQKDLQKIRRQAEEAVQSANISAIRNNGERERAEQDAQHLRNVRQIEQQADDMKKAVYESRKKAWENSHKDSPYELTAEGGAGWSGIELSEDQLQIIKSLLDKENAEYSRIIRERYEDEMSAQRDFLKEYGNYEQQKLAITEEYEQKIREASSPTQRASLALERDEQIRQLGNNTFQNNVDWQGVFSNLQSHTREYLEGLRDQLQNVLSEGALPVDQLSVVQEKLLEVNTAISQQSGLFDYIGDKQREHNRLLQQAADAQEILNRRKSEEVAANTEVMRLTQDIRDILTSANVDSSTGINDSLLNQFDKNSKQYQQIAALLEQLHIAEGKLASARKKTGEATKNASNAEDSARRKATTAVADWFSDAQQFIVDKGIDQLPDLFNSIGLGKVGDKMSKGLSGFNNAAGAFADYVSGNYIGAAVKAIGAIKDFGSALGIGGGNAAKVNKTTERLTEVNEKLAERISDLKEAIGESAGAKAISAYHAALEAQKELEKNNLEKLKAQMGYHSAHHSNEYFVDNSEIRRLYNESRNVLSKAGYDLGTINGLSSIYNLTPDQLKAIKDFAPDLWQYLTEVGKYDKSQYWDDVVEQAGKAAELTEQMRNNLTQTSWTSMRDGFLDALLDMDRSAEDFAHNFEDMMFKALVNAFVLDDNFDEWLNGDNGFYRRWADKLEKDSMTEADWQSFEKEYTDEFNKRREMVNALRNQFGYTDSSTYSQSASAKTWQSLGQQTGEELNGRFTALQMSGEKISQDVVTIVATLNLITEVSSSQGRTLTELLSLAITRNSILDTMQGYTKKIYTDFNDKLNTLVNQTKNI